MITNDFYLAVSYDRHTYINKHFLNKLNKYFLLVQRGLGHV